MMSVLPEDCISKIISLTSPKDSCRSSAVSRGFKFSSESDTVWERFLPKDYQEIISNSVSPINYLTKKELYIHFSQSTLLLNGGNLSFWLNKSSGMKCYMLSARELSIAWKDSPMYWNWTSLVDSRFSEVAELLSVCWLEIKGKMHTRMLSLNTHYAAYLVFKISANAYGLNCAMKTAVRFTDNSSSDESDNVFLTRTVQPDQITGRRRGWRPVSEDRSQGRLPEQRNDGWMEIYLGKIFNHEGHDNEVEMCVYETSILDWKKGLIVEGIELRSIEGS